MSSVLEFWYKVGVTVQPLTVQPPLETLTRRSLKVSTSVLPSPFVKSSPFLTHTLDGEVRTNRGPLFKTPRGSKWTLRRVF